MRKTLFAVALLAFIAGTASALDVTLTNNQTGTDEFTVVLNEDAYSYQAYIQAPGQSRENLMYDYYLYIDIGGSVYNLWDGTSAWDDSDASDQSITSSGAVAGINWSVTHTLPDGGDIMTSAYTLTAPTGALLPEMRLFQYLDEDVYSISNNILVPSGSIAGGDLELLTVHPTIRAGVSQAGDSQATGWAADEYYDLGFALDAGGFNAAPGGTVDTTSLPPHTDPYYGPAYGPEDITTAIEWEVGSGLSSFAFEAYLGGLPEAPPPPPTGEVPEPTTTALFLLGLGGLAGGYYRKRRAK
jgi:hypothetical protein